MASETAIAAIISQALTYCRRHERHEVDAAIRLWSDVFGRTSTDDLKAAVTQWAVNLPDGHIPSTLPRPKQIQAIMAGGDAAPPDRRPAYDDPASPEYKQAHADAGRQIAALWGGLTGTLDNPKPVAPADREERRQRTADILDALPRPTTPVAKPCRCDGTGFIDTAESLEALTGGDGIRAVYPCRVCRPDQFRRWVDGAYARTS